MRNTIIHPAKHAIEAHIDDIASDKSISHRSVIFSFLSTQKSRIKNYLLGEDTLNTLKIAIQLGAKVECDDRIWHKNTQKYAPNELTIQTDEIREPDDVLDCGNAGTAMRLYMGLLAPAKGQFILSGDKYLRARPMSRIINPLRDVGAQITARSYKDKPNELAPICVQGSTLKAFSYRSNISSAQVKTAMILAALQGREKSHFSEISKSRDHSERILLGMGANLAISDNNITINPVEKPLEAIDMEIPADPSSAFYFALLSSIVPDSHVTLKNVLLNETRIEAFMVLQKMGAKLDIVRTQSQYEDIGNISISYAPLHSVQIDSNISWLIDEIPALAIACACASGKSTIKNAKELRVKESDRINATIEGLRAFGVEVEELEDGMIITGGLHPPAKKIKVNSYGDHRIAMSFAILGVLAEVEIEDSACIDVSFPNFLDILSRFTNVESKEI